MYRLPFSQSRLRTLKQNCMKWCPVIIIILFCWQDSIGQSKIQAGTTREDTIYLRKLLDSAKSLRQKDTVRHTAIAAEILRISQNINSKPFIVLALLEKSILASNENAIKFLTAAIPIAKECKDTMLTAGVYNYLGFKYKLVKQHMHALDCFFETMKLLSQKPATRELENALSHIGNIYMELDDPRGLLY